MSVSQVISPAPRPSRNCEATKLATSSKENTRTFFIVSD